MLTELLLNRLPFTAPIPGSPVSAPRTSQATTQKSAKESTQSPAAIVSISQEGIEKSRDSQNADKPKDSSGKPLSEEEQQQVDELKKRDREVHIHEQTHMAAAGGYAKGGPQYDYQSGPDGKQYAVGGHVNLDTSAENTPEATLQKANILRKAATAPADPSGQDRSVAAAATQMAMEARQEITAKSSEGEEQQAGMDRAIKGYSSFSASSQSASQRSWFA